MAQLTELIKRKYPLGLEDVEQASKVLLADPDADLKEIFLDTVYVTNRNRPVTPKGFNAEGVHRRHPQVRHRLRHRPRGHRQDVPRHGHGGRGAGRASRVKRIVLCAAGGRGGREARLPARRSGGEGEALPPPALRRAPRHDGHGPRERRSSSAARSKWRRWPSCAAARSNDAVRHPRRGAEHHHRADEDVPDPPGLRLEGGHHRRRRRRSICRPARRRA